MAASVFTVPLSRSEPRGGKSGQLVFARVKDRLFLSQVWFPGGRSVGLELLAPRGLRDEIRDAAETVAGNSTQLFGFTTAVKNNFSYQERVELVETLWEVIYADGKADAYEQQLMRRIGGLIYVTDRDSGLARRRVRNRINQS